MATGDTKTKWNGENGHTLPDSSPSKIKVELRYEGKTPAEEILATKSAKIRTLWQPSSDGDDNRLYYGDNLPVLASLLQNPDIKGRVRLVYIDPPFATNSVFKSRSQKDAYTDLLSGGEFIEFLRQRLILLRELLAEDGSIYLHLDSNMAFHIKVVMDEVFGGSNFRNFITRRKSNPKNYTRKTYGNVSDYILFYTKSDDYVWNRAYEPWTPEKVEKEYQYIEKETGRRYKKVPVHAPGTRNGETGKPWRGKEPPPGKHWQYPPSVLDEMDERGEIYWSPNGNPRRKIYLDQSQGVAVQDIWLDVRDAHNQNIKITGYPTEKPPELLKRIVEASSNPGDLVLDCFSGSGTTLAVASELGRNWIGIDNSREAIETTLKRFLVGLEPMGNYVEKPMSDKPTTLPLPIVIEPEIGDFTLFAVENSHSDIQQTVQEWQSNFV
ncbi:MAG: site-specific DNA-methyltransferase [Anaerolineaceae bacterium]|nr:site-specific DNA-methyltransferase [Anaerolineaceae bacterium]